MTAQPESDTYLADQEGGEKSRSPFQRLADTDGWIGQVLPGLVAVFFIVIVALAVMAGEGALMASARSTNLSTLEAVLSNTIQRFDDWARDRENDVRVWAQDESVVSALEELSVSPVRGSLETAPAQQRLRDRLGPWLTEYGYRGYLLISNNGTTLASVRNSDLAEPAMMLDLVNLDRLSTAGALLTRPHIVDLVTINPGDENGQVDEEILMYSIAEVHRDGERLGYLALRIDPLGEYAATFRVGRTGVSGETYAIDRTGRLLTETRYGEEFINAGLLAEGHPSMLHVEVRDPGVDVTRGAIPSRPYAQWPLTVAARNVIEDGRGHNLRGYRDSRGVLVMGAWRWDDVRDIGVITEIDVIDALAGANQARAVLRVFAVAMALSFILLAVLFSAHRTITRRRAQATAAAKGSLQRHNRFEVHLVKEVLCSHQ